MIKMVPLSPNSQEYKDVEAKFKKTMYRADIKSIQRIESLSLWQVGGCGWDCGTRELSPDSYGPDSFTEYVQAG